MTLKTSWFRKKSITKQKKLKDSFLLDSLPNEMTIKIFDLIGKDDLLNCRLTNWTICRRINDFYLSRYDFHLDDKSYNELFQSRFHKLSFYPQCVLHVKNLRNTVSCSIFRKNFSNINELNFSTHISEENFSRILNAVANLKILRLTCSTLGGTEKLFSDIFLYDYNDDTMTWRENFENKKTLPICSQMKKLCSKSRNASSCRYEIPISELHLSFSYVPITGKKGFCENLLRNLSSLQTLRCPDLFYLEFSIQRSDLHEKFMLSIGQLFKSIPKCNYSTLRRLVINGPCFYFRPQNNEELLDVILKMKLQLNHFVLDYDSKHNCMDIPWIISKFLETQNSLNYVKIVCSGTVLLESINYKQESSP